MRVLLLLISAFSVFWAQAQMVTVKEKPSFYLGKRANLTFALGLQPTLFPSKPVTNNPDGPNNTNRLIYGNVKSEFTFNIALNNKVAVYLKGATLRTSRTTNFISYYDQVNSNYYTLREETTPAIRGRTVGAGFSFYRKSRAAIAPMGSHFSIGLSKHTLNISYEDSKLIERGSNFSSKPFELDISDRTSSFHYFSLEMAFTNNQPITQNLYYHYGFSTSINSVRLNALLEDSSAKDDIDEQLFDSNLSALSFRDFAVLKIGLGYMLF
jgi:hypothetical protein